MPITKANTLIACKMMALLPGFSVAERRVGAAIIDHYNRKDGRCDPGLERLADLLGFDRRTILRAVKVLGNAGLISRRRHGGRSLRNSYEPTWPKFHELHDEWQRKFSGRSSPAVPVTAPPSDPGQVEASASDSAVTQTFKTNLKREPLHSGRPIEPTNNGSEQGAAAKWQPRQGRGRLPTDKTRALPMTPDSRDAALNAAHRRWEADLRQSFGDRTDLYGEIIGEIDEDLANAASEAEMRQRGAGTRHVLQVLGRTDRRYRPPGGN